MSSAPSLRPARAADLAAVTRIYNQAIRDTTATFDTEEKGEDWAAGWLTNHRGPSSPALVAEVHGEVQGWATLSPWSDRCAYSGTAEVSVYVDADARGQGLGRALLAALIEAGRRGGLHTLLARIAEGNPASAGLHEALGFVATGVMREVGRKFGRRLDVTLYQRMLGPDPEHLTPSRIQRELLALGVLPGDVLMVHASLKALGQVIGGPEGLARSLLAAVGTSGTLLVYAGWDQSPYHLDRLPPATRQLYLDELPAYDPATSPAVRSWSRLNEVLRTWPGARRSPHPDASFVAVGAQAEALTATHPLDYGYGPEGPLGQLVAQGGKVLMLGAPLETLTLLHHAEHLARVEGKRVARYRVPITRDGARTWIELEEFDTSRGIVDWPEGDMFDALGRDALSAGVGTAGPVGAATCQLFDARRLVDYAVEWMETRLPGGAGFTGGT